MPRGSSYTVKLRKTGRDGTTGSLSVPLPIMELLEAGLAFQPELVEDGILFRLVTAPEVEAIPAWVQNLGHADEEE